VQLLWRRGELAAGGRTDRGVARVSPRTESLSIWPLAAVGWVAGFVSSAPPPNSAEGAPQHTP
jgi:hypothetical protein